LLSSVMPAHGRRVPASGLGDQVGEHLLDTRKSLTLSETSSLVSSHHHGIRAAGKTSALDGERLPQQSLDVVALDGAAHLARHR
jgi:hypothetical protein